MTQAILDKTEIRSLKKDISNNTLVLSR